MRFRTTYAVTVLFAFSAFAFPQNHAKPAAAITETSCHSFIAKIGKETGTFDQLSETALQSISRKLDQCVEKYASQLNDNELAITRVANGYVVALMNPTADEPERRPAPAPSRNRAAQPASTGSMGWTPSLGDKANISKSQFQHMGLGKLTVEEFDFFANFMQDREAAARYVAQVAAANASLQGVVTSTCVPPRPNQPIRVFISENNNPPEFTSAFRKGLRDFRDVEIVYEKAQADIGISVLVMKTNTRGGVEAGYTGTITTFDSCKFKLGENSWDVSVMNRQSIYTGATVNEISEPMIVSIDTSDLEEIRKLQSTIRNRK